MKRSRKTRQIAYRFGCRTNLIRGREGERHTGGAIRHRTHSDHLIRQPSGTNSLSNEREHFHTEYRRILEQKPVERISKFGKKKVQKTILQRRLLKSFTRTKTLPSRLFRSNKQHHNRGAISTGRTCALPRDGGSFDVCLLFLVIVVFRSQVFASYSSELIASTSCV